MSLWLRKWTARLLLRSVVGVFAAAARLGRWLSRQRRASTAAGPRTLVLTGTFYSQNWILNHLRPLEASAACSCIWLVSYLEIPAFPKVIMVRPPARLRRLLGEAPARLLTFAWTVLRVRPDVVGGFHLLLNGLLAAALAPWVGARSLYHCGGGFLEVKGGGWKADNRLFDLLPSADAVLERQLVGVVSLIDHVITMGPRAIADFRAAGANTHFTVIHGGIDPARYPYRHDPKRYDLILVGHLLPVKRIDLFLRSIQCLKADYPAISAAIVGEGRLESELKALAAQLGIQDHVTFAGYQSDIFRWLSQSRVFVLTSDSEGLSLAMMEAVMAGLPCVVSDVGELGELIEEGRNGHLVKDRTPEGFARCLLPLLQDEARRQRLSRQTREAATRISVQEATACWDRLLSVCREESLVSPERKTEPAGSV